MFRQTKKLIISFCLLFALLGGVIFTPLTVKAETYVQNTGNEFYVRYARPSTSDTQGFVNLYYSTGVEVFVITIFWNLVSELEDGTPSNSQAAITLNDTSWEFNCFTTGYTERAYYSLYMYNRDGHCWHLKSSGSDKHIQTTTANIIGYQAYGDVQIIDNLSVANSTFTVYYSDDGSAVLLRKVIELLEYDMQSDDYIRETIYAILNNTEGIETQLEAVVDYLKSVDDKLTSIKTELEYIYAKCDELLEEQKESNSWLEKIFNHLTESKEQEKQEAQTQGSNSTSQGTGAIEDKGAGFTDSLGGLVSSMSYTGTECAWDFPKLTIPAIPGVMDELTLMESQPIDFAVWVSAIPSNILIVVQSLLTIGLIVYCFKELYSTIAYVLTLRKDDNA